MENIIVESNQSQSDTGSTPDVIFYKTKPLTHEMYQRLADYSLIERYGTYMEYGTEHEYSAYIQKKYVKLKAELLKVFKGLDEEINCFDLFKFFSLYETKTNIHLTQIYIERFYEDLFIDVNIKVTV